MVQKGSANSKSKVKNTSIVNLEFVINHRMESLGQDNCTLCTPFQSHKSGKIHFFILRASN